MLFDKGVISLLNLHQAERRVFTHGQNHRNPDPTTGALRLLHALAGRMRLGEHHGDRWRMRWQQR
mgnify:CR=1 FL=1